MTCLFKRQRRIAGRRDGSRQALQRPSSCTPISPLSSPLRLKCCPDHVHLANAPRHMPQLRPALDQAKSENPIASACGPRVPAWVALRRQTASQTLHHFRRSRNLRAPRKADIGSARLRSFNYPLKCAKDGRKLQLIIKSARDHRLLGYLLKSGTPVTAVSEVPLQLA